MLRSWNCSASLIASDSGPKVNMSNELALRLWIDKSPCKHSSRFIASGLPAGQDTKRAGRSSHPAQLYSRSTTLESLLSVALREASVERLDCIIQFHSEKVGSLLLLGFNSEVHQTDRRILQ